MLVSCCVRSGMIFSYHNRECATVRNMRRKRRRERDGGSAGSASAAAQATCRRGVRGLACCSVDLFALCLLSPLLGEDVI